MDEYGPPETLTEGSFHRILDEQDAFDPRNFSAGSSFFVEVYRNVVRLSNYNILSKMDGIILLDVSMVSL